MKRTNLGFSLVELLVVIAIFLTITSVILFNQDKMSSDVSLSNVTYEIALKIRQTQTYGIMVKSTKDSFDNAYGVHFYKDPANGKIKFKVFADNPLGSSANLLKYDEDSSVPDTTLSDHSIEEGNVISDVCTYGIIDVPATKNCMLTLVGGDTVETVDVVFKRPESAAIITNDDGMTHLGELNIEVTSALGDKSRIIKVFGSGQISVYDN